MHCKKKGIVLEKSYVYYFIYRQVGYLYQIIKKKEITMKVVTKNVAKKVAGGQDDGIRNPKE